MKKAIEKFKEQFVHHELTTIVDTDDVKIYEFRNPKNSNLWQKWILHHNRLIVVGDAYDAIYHSGAFESLESISSCNFGYFNNKCVSDKDGYDQSVFDSDTAVKSVHRCVVYCKETEIEYFKKENPEHELTILDISKKKVDIYDITADFLIAMHLHNKGKDKWDRTDVPSHFDNSHEVSDWCYDNEELVGQDWWEGFSTNEITNVPFWHLAAIKVAVEKMKQ